MNFCTVLSFKVLCMWYTVSKIMLLTVCCTLDSFLGYVYYGGGHILELVAKGYSCTCVLEVC